MTPEDDLRSPREKASKIPSWIMVGFTLGALTFYTVSDYLRPAKKDTPPPALPESAPATPAAPAQNTDTPAPKPDDEQINLFSMDAVFRKWAVNAQWEYNTAQVVFWSPADKKYSVPVEVLRYGSEGDWEYYYRPIEKITRPLVRAPAYSDVPVLFTENEATTQRRKEQERNTWFGR